MRVKAQTMEGVHGGRGGGGGRKEKPNASASTSAIEGGKCLSGRGLVRGQKRGERNGQRRLRGVEEVKGGWRR
jgi:hypothetical protein